MSVHDGLIISDLCKISSRSQYKLIGTDVKKQYSDTYTCRDLAFCTTYMYICIHVFIILQSNILTHPCSKHQLTRLEINHPCSKHQLTRLEINHPITHQICPKILMIIFAWPLNNLNILLYLKMKLFDLGRFIQFKNGHVTMHPGLVWD